MSADLLRRAVAKLRDALAADYLTDGPWDCLDAGDRIVHVSSDGEVYEYVVDEPMSNPSNAEYIALMHPPVAGGLADWLEAIAECAEVGVHLMPERAEAMARLILREQAEESEGERHVTEHLLELGTPAVPVVGGPACGKGCTRGCLPGPVCPAVGGQS